MLSTTSDFHSRCLVLDAAGTLPLVGHPQAAGLAVSAPALSDALRSLHAELTSRVLAPADIAERWVRIADLAAQTLAHTKRFAEPSKRSSDAAIRDLSALAPDARSLALRIRSDDFFEVRRVVRLRPAQLSYELVKLVARVAPDLAVAPLGLAQVSAIAACLDDLISQTSGADSVRTRDHERGRAVATSPSDEPAAALRRWRCGHHLFFLATQAATHHAQQGEAALDVDETLAAHELDRAALHTRAMSAALWYASTMPSALYAAEVRPLMRAKSRPGEGFSGLDSYDNLAMTFAVDALRSRLLQAPPSGQAALAAERLFEAIIEHHEHHVLVAAATVGTATSLHRDADRAAAQVPAVEILRGAVTEATEHFDELRNAVRGRGEM